MRTIRNILYHIFWWDMKEWRPDRMKVHLSETVQGNRWMFGSMSSLKWILLLLYIFPYPFELNWIVYGVYTVEAIKITTTFTKDKRPDRFRPKIALLFFGTVVFELLLVPLISFDYPLGLALLIGDKCIAIAIFVQVAILNMFYSLYKNGILWEARLKVEQAKHLYVIGITGSFGKTTTKEFTYQLLSNNYRTFKSEKSQNSDIGIAELIIRTDLSKYDYFVCEMAAYHPGEIASSTSILKGKIKTVVITGINQQHQSLFKGIEVTKKSKYELIENSIPHSTVIVNAQNEGAKEMGAWAKRDEHTVRFVKKLNVDKLYPSEDIAPQYKINATLAAEIAYSIGMTKTQVSKNLTLLQLPDKTMNEVKKGHMTIINDTFNANPDAVYAGLEYIRNKKGNKILVLQPLIELGSYTDEVHEKIGQMTATICDMVILTNDNWNKSFLKGVALVKGNKLTIQIRGLLPKLTNGVYLFEGKEAESYLKKL